MNPDEKKNLAYTEQYARIQEERHHMQQQNL